MLGRLIRRQPRQARCYWVAIHFADAEQASQWLNDDAKRERSVLTGREVRLLATGESIPECEL